MVVTTGGNIVGVLLIDQQIKDQKLKAQQKSPTNK